MTSSDDPLEEFLERITALENQADELEQTNQELRQKQQKLREVSQKLRKEQQELRKENQAWDLSVSDDPRAPEHSETGETSGRAHEKRPATD